MRASGAAILLVLTVLSACTGGPNSGNADAVRQAQVGTGDFGPDDLVECRELGGGWRYADYGGLTTTGLGRLQDGGISAGGPPEGITYEESVALREEQGWDEQAVAALGLLKEESYEFALDQGFVGTEEEFEGVKREIRALLDSMPRCADP